MSLRILAHAAGLMEDKHILYKIMVCDSSPKHVVKYARKSESTLDSLLKYIVEKEHEDEEDEPISLNRIQSFRPRYGSESAINYKKPSFNSNQTISDQKCDKCGFSGGTNHSNCPSKNEMCRYCNNKGHFERCCRKKKKDQLNKHNTIPRPSKSGKSYSVQEMDDLTSISTMIPVNSMNSYMPSCIIDLEGEYIKFLPDSGSGANIITKDRYLTMKNPPNLSPSTAKLQPYKPNSKCLNLLGEFLIKAKMANCESRIPITIVVVDNENQPIDNLLGMRTLRKLGFDFNELLGNETFGLVNSVNLTENIKQHPKYKTLFRDEIGCIPNVKITINPNPSVKPVRMPMQEIPTNLQEAVSQKF